MSTSIYEQVADPNRFISVGAIRMVTINAAVVFEDVATRIWNVIPKFISGRDKRSTLIDEEPYRDFEESHPVESLFAEDRPDPAFQIMAAQRNQLSSVFVDATATRTDLQNAQMVRVNANISP